MSRSTAIFSYYALVTSKSLPFSPHKQTQPLMGLCSLCGSKKYSYPKQMMEDIFKKGSPLKFPIFFCTNFLILFFLRPLTPQSPSQPSLVSVQDTPGPSPVRRIWGPKAAKETTTPWEFQIVHDGVRIYFGTTFCNTDCLNK